MKTKELIKELILPSFWLLFFVAFSKSNYTPAKGKKVTGLNKQEIKTNSSEVINTVEKSRNTNFIKAVYLSNL